MNGVEEAQNELCSNCPDNILGICNPSEVVCGDVMRLSVVSLLTKCEQKKEEKHE